MKISIEKKNNKFYLEVERPHYPTNCGPSSGREVDKIYRKIERNIEKYGDEPYNVQYLNVKKMVMLIKNYFELKPNVLKIKLQYKRKYPSEWLRIKETDSAGRRYSFWGEVFTKDFIKEKIKVLKVKEGE